MFTLQECNDAISRLEIEEKGIRVGFNVTVPALSEAATFNVNAESDVKALEDLRTQSAESREHLSEARTILMDSRCQLDELTRMQRERTQRLERIQDERSSWIDRLNILKSPEGQGV